MEKELSFEDRLKEIDKILELFNDKNITLKESLEAYKKGVTLLKEASKILENAKLQIEELKVD
ncbi:exodeoxyribonuclease VII small subunit [uncultured Campylobacter sp.]|uniref:exodeoxyribonuclease VII small subunit n=1 Tax=uncultured Campylobacter sp. TaxID=218934 RepID=UPI00261AA905|nr:exodeoxyribonuclease VII small subunit [uncultured Campylobacter sp.]